MYFAEFDSDGYALVQYATLASSITNTQTIIVDDLTNLAMDTSKVQVLVDDEVETMTESITASSPVLLNGSILDFNVIEFDEIGEDNGTGVNSEVAVTQTITYTSSRIKLEIVAYQYHKDLRSKLRMVITVTSLTPDDYRVSYRFLDGAFIDSANPSNFSAYIYEGVLGTGDYFGDNTPPRAYFAQDDISSWNDISGNSYDATLSTESGVWNTDYNGFSGSISFEPASGDVYSEEDFEGIKRDSFINENYFSRTMFKANFTIEMLIYLESSGTVNLYTISNTTHTNAETKSVTLNAGYNHIAVSYLLDSENHNYIEDTYINGELMVGGHTINTNVYDNIDRVYETREERKNPQIDKIKFGGGYITHSIRVVSGYDSLEEIFMEYLPTLISNNYKLDMDRYTGSTLYNGSEVDISEIKEYDTSYLNIWYDGYYSAKDQNNRESQVAISDAYVTIGGVDYVIYDGFVVDSTGDPGTYAKIEDNKFTVSSVVYTISNGFVYYNNGTNYIPIRMGSGINLDANVEYSWSKDANNKVVGSMNETQVQFCNDDSFTFTSCLILKWPTASTLDEGKYMLEMKLTDGNGNTIRYANNESNRLYVSGFIDRTPPRVALNSLTPNYDGENITSITVDKENVYAYQVYPTAGIYTFPTTIILGIQFSEKVSLPVNETTGKILPQYLCALPTLMVQFARGENYQADDVYISPCTNGVDNGTIKIVGRNILYKYRLTKGDNGTLIYSGQDSTNNKINGNPNIFDPFGNIIVDTQTIIDIVPHGAIKGDTDAPYIVDILNVGKYVRKNNTQFTFNVVFSEKVKILSTFYLKLDIKNVKAGTITTDVATCTPSGNDLVNNIDCTFTYNSTDDVEVGVHILKNISEQIPTASNGVMLDNINAVALCYKPDCSDLNDGLTVEDTKVVYNANGTVKSEPLIMDAALNGLTRILTTPYIGAIETEDDVDIPIVYHKDNMIGWFNNSQYNSYGFETVINSNMKYNRVLTVKIPLVDSLENAVTIDGQDIMFTDGVNEATLYGFVCSAPTGATSLDCQKEVTYAEVKSISGMSKLAYNGINQYNGLMFDTSKTVRAYEQYQLIVEVDKDAYIGGILTTGVYDILFNRSFDNAIATRNHVVKDFMCEATTDKYICKKVMNYDDIYKLTTNRFDNVYTIGNNLTTGDDSNVIASGIEYDIPYTCASTPSYPCDFTLEILHVGNIKVMLNDRVIPISGIGDAITKTILRRNVGVDGYIDIYQFEMGKEESLTKTFLKDPDANANAYYLKVDSAEVKIPSLNKVYINDTRKIYTTRLYNTYVSDTALINNNISDNEFVNYDELKYTLTTNIDLRDNLDNKSILFNSVYYDVTDPVLGVSSGETPWQSEFKLAILNEKIIQILANQSIYNDAYYINSKENQFAAIVRNRDSNYTIDIGAKDTIVSLIGIDSNYNIVVEGYESLYVKEDDMYIHIILFRIVGTTSEIGEAEVGLELNGIISDNAGNSSELSVSADTVSKIVIHVDNVQLNVVYTPDTGGETYDFVNYISIQNQSNVEYAGDVVEALQGIIQNTINDKCGNNANYADCYYTVRTENLLPTYVGENVALASNTGVSYGNGSTINIRVKLKSYVENPTFTLTYKGAEFTCTKDGDMYADCISEPLSSGQSIPVSHTIPEEIPEGDNTIYIANNAGRKYSVLHDNPVHSSIEFVEAYLNGSLNSIASMVASNTVDSYVKYDIVYYITVYVVDKAGNVSQDVRVIHVVNRTKEGVAIATNTGINTYTITQGASFNLPELIATITNFDNHTMTDIKNYNLFFEYNGKRVKDIDTSLVGTYKVYAETMVNGKLITQLVYTLNIEEGYVHVQNISNNYVAIVLMVILYSGIFAIALYIQKKRKLI